ncbi:MULTISPECIES: helix-turn-helix domain-containing protein [unclassified Streptomyces]|uniref:AraC family transcriptional regulator n=1 Tax=unclassified Streptomyces TaxID=2593676 RepID=UPI000DC778F8|nr:MULTISPECIES: helix-turn-helix domain-containing protein [unclassified Streptomyces]AWZ07726.1 AraC family transcriptional regulator [Streptomyces sp. ICC4]AWZ15397.1 AraC family transcriptional regulator [Streptomyces sp. ICC1]
MGSVDVIEVPGGDAPAPHARSARRRRPAPALRPLIVNYTGFHTEFTEPRHRLELPTGYVTLVFNFCDGLWVTRTEELGEALLRPASRAMVSGPRTVPAIGVHAGVVHGLEVNMSPLGCYRLFGVPMWHFEDAHVDLADVLGPGGRFLTERLRSLGSWTERFALLDEVLCARLERGPLPAPEVRGALSGLWADSRSLTRVSSETGWSARTLRARFREQVGLSPKAVARVFRLQHALGLLAAGTAAAHVAAVCGYHDQAHLSREVKAMTGLPPSRFVRLRGGLAPGSALDRMPGRVSSVMLSG